MINYNQDKYDFLSVSIHNEMLAFLQVNQIEYPQTYNHQLIPGGIGNPMIAHIPTGVARGRFDGSFTMKLFKGAWLKLCFLYRLAPFGIHTSDPMEFIVTYKSQNRKTISVDSIAVVIKSAKPENISNKGGEMIEVSVEGFQTRPVKTIYQGFSIDGTPVI